MIQRGDTGAGDAAAPDRRARDGGDRIAFVTHRAAFAELLAGQLAERRGHVLVGCAATAAALEPTERPSIVLIDVPEEVLGAELDRVATRWPDAVVVAVARPEAASALARANRPVVVPPTADVERLLASIDGAGHSVVVLGADVLEAARRRLRDGAPQPVNLRLTGREQEVLSLLGRGLRPTAIAGLLGISVHTCRRHVKSLLVKFDAHGQVELLVRATEAGLLPGGRRAATGS